jgi:hypothetical protein
MTSIRERDWPAQQPPADFAERAVSAMLSPMRLAPAPAGQHRKPYLYWFLAALLASGSALGITWSRHYHGRPPVRLSAIQPLPVPNSLTRAPSISAAVRSAPALLKVAPVPKLMSNHAPKTQPKVTPPLPPPRTPACQCERGFADFICDCY